MDTTLAPGLPSSTCVLRRGDRILFLVPDKPDWVVVNDNLARVLSLCDGTRSVNDLLDLAGEGDFREELAGALERLVEADFFTESAGEKKQRTLLNSLHLNMTGACNLACVYCYAEERDNSSSDRLALEDWKRVVEEARTVSERVTVTFTGGEPLLNPHTLEVAAHCHRLGLETFLLTNGTLVNADNVDAVADCFDTIRVSLDGSSAETHDRHRGKGAYARTVAALELLESRGGKPLVAMTVTGWNTGEVETLTRRFGNRLTFQPLYSVGRARELDLHLEGADYYRVLRDTPGVEPYGRIASRLATLRNHGCTKCSVGDGEISVASDGNVYPCHMLHVEEYVAGNVRTSSFADIYYGSDVLRKIRSMSVERREDCRECPIRLLCGGGCWARAHYSHGTLNSCDSFCDYELLAITDGLFNTTNL